ncbi:endoribonuclease YbeY-like isoform X2 [Octodon degus]|uniref:Endoribonuclease YbeY-like isoform X2 n=1 Tax=Octodon degus TaxID=10160 RepID=A0A6P6EFH5_OCTDE|nr:endoribonuclease YbeY-like isoform X2 [Octodon degus]
MSLVIRNLQSVIPIRKVPLRRNVEIIRSILRVEKFDLGIIFLDNKNIQHINGVYIKKNIPTDVLLFPFHDVTATHGLCHLLRFTHNSETEWQNMYLQEKQVLEELSRCTGAQLLPLSRGLF